MTDISKLRDLLERVESATGPDREIDLEFARIEGWTLEKMKGDAKPHWRKPGETRYFMRSIYPSVTSSIDAAVALCERVLPGWEIRIGELPDKVGWFARVLRRKDMFLVSSRDCGPKHAGIALCAVVLRAKIAMLEKDAV